ncbi:hypothetical protein EON63_05680 [archaeon]|nr:MAG: hypothetical protein EON63_05680 [archaeon]
MVISDDIFIAKDSKAEFRCIRDLEITSDEERQVIATANEGMIMTDKEKILLHRNLLNASVYFEYGCGGSTELVCVNHPNMEIHSIDTSAKWIEAVQDHKCIQDGIEKKRVHMTWVDIGDLTRFGYPATEAKKHQWPVYSESIKTVGQNVDFVLIDGRFRVASCLKSLLNTNPARTKIAIHDFFVRTPYYVVLKYADVIDCQNQLIVLRAKPDFDRKALMEDMQTHMYAGL